MRNSVKKAAVTALVCVTAAGMMAGCAKKKLDGTKNAVTVNKQEIPIGVVSMAARMQQAQAEAMYRMYLGGGSDRRLLRKLPRTSWLPILMRQLQSLRLMKIW